MKLTVGCTTRPYATLPFDQACQRIAAAGYTDVALFRNALEPNASRDETLRAREIALDSGLDPSMLLGRARPELGLDQAITEYKQVIDNAATLGAAWLLDTGTNEPALYDTYFALMQHAAPYAASVGIQITLKPHGGITLTTADLIAAYHRTNHPAFGICYDPGNIIYYTLGEEMPQDDVSKVAPMVTTGIIKDCIVHDGKPDVMITPGEGWVDFAQVLRPT